MEEPQCAQRPYVQGHGAVQGAIVREGVEDRATPALSSRYLRVGKREGSTPPSGCTCAAMNADARSAGLAPYTLPTVSLR
jgi:hypothetical protein